LEERKESSRKYVPISELKDVIYIKENHIAKITLNRPDAMNALTERTHDELASAIKDAEEDDDVRVLIITGRGRGFCAGDDIKELFLGGGREEESLRARMEPRESKLRQLQGASIRGGADRLMTLNKPTIAAVNGAAVGYGCEIALMCDARIAAESARFGLGMFLRMGLIPKHGLYLLPLIVGFGKANELILSGEIIDAREAERIGLANKVVPNDKLEEETVNLAKKMMRCAPISIELSKELQRRAFNYPLKLVDDYFTEMFSFCAQSEDHLEAARAWVEKREPRFKRR